MSTEPTREEIEALDSALTKLDATPSPDTGRVPKVEERSTLARAGAIESDYYLLRAQEWAMEPE